MKKQIRFRGFVAFLLALSLAFMGSVSSFADDPVTADLGNIAYLEITTGGNGGEIHYNDYDGQEDNIPSGSTITAGTVDYGLLFGKTEEDEDYFGQYVCTEDFTGQVTVQVGDVGSEDEECYDSAVWMNVSGENSTVNLETGSLYSGYAGLLVDNADASVEVKTKDIAVSGESSYCTYGVYLGDSNAADTLFGSFGEFDAYTGNAKTTVSVDGDIAVNSELFSTGISVGASLFSALTNGGVKVDATGSLTVTSDCYAQGITVYEDGGSADIGVGSISTESAAASYGTVIANYGAGSTSVTVGEGISSVAEDLAVGISALTADSKADVSVTVKSGGIAVEGEINELEDPNPYAYNTTAIMTHNANGTISISAAGEVTSTGYGMMLFDTASVMEDDDDWDTVIDPSAAGQGQEGSAGLSKTLVEIAGNVTADECGVYFNLQNDSSSMDVLIDGTLSGETTSVLLSNETVTDSLKLTVWEVKKNEDGNLVERIDNWKEDDDDWDEDMVTVADREMEKKIQYIIKIDPAWENRIGTAGTSSYKQAGDGTEYQVAREGDRITLLKLDIPEGKQIAAAYWDINRSKSCKLLKDKATGDYYLTVPRGGGVWLSVVLEDIPDGPVGRAPNVLLTLNDLDNKIKLRAFKGGNFVAEMESGNPSESGSFIRQGDRLILADSNNQQTPVNADGTFTYTSVENPSLSYRFAMNEEQYALLLANAKE